MTKKRESKISAQEPVDAGTLHERIAQRAYELYEMRGREDGFDLQDWLQAEQEALSELGRFSESAIQAEEGRSQAETAAKTTA
jgi:hypothetical protein